MVMNLDQVVDNYRSQYQIYERFTNKVRDLLEELLTTNGISASYEHRTKVVEHFKEKISRPGKSYDDPLNEITDLCGVRIIVRRVSDVSEVIKVIEKEFEIDEGNSIYKAAELNVDQFGYTSVHLVGTLSEGRDALTEWRPFKQLKVEIQVRTILQHAWAVISHTFDYKVGADIPRDFQRRLFRLSALFELADEELDQLVDDIEEKIEKYRASLKTGNTKIELNVDSLRTYIETASEVRYWIEYVGGLAPVDITWGDLSKTLETLKSCGIETLEDVQRIMIDSRGWGEVLLKEYLSRAPRIFRIPLRSFKITKNGIVGVLVFGANAERFTPEQLTGMFSHHEGMGVLQSVALDARGIDSKP